MQVNAKGRAFEAVLRREDGRMVGYGQLRQLMEAFGVPVVGLAIGNRLVPLRLFAEAFSLPHQYDPVTDTFHIASVPLPSLPAEPVGADVRPWLPVTPVIMSGPGDRRPQLLERVIQQFRVATNPRYRQNQQGAGETYCNIFSWDVSRALGAEIPHWVAGPQLASARPGADGAWEMDANATIQWLRRYGPDYGWKSTGAEGALLAANMGRPAVAAWLNPGGIGHVAMVRPGAHHPERGLPIAQSGAVNFDDGYLVDGFGSRGDQVEFFVHS